MRKGMNYVENRTALPPASNHFVLDVLMKKGEEFRNQHLKKYEESRERVFSSGADPDLIAPIARAMEQIGDRNRGIRDELTRLKEHVEKVRCTWGTYWGSTKSSRQMAVWSKAKRSADRQMIARRIEELRNEFALNPGPDEIGTLIALDPRLVSKLKASIAAGTKDGFSDKFAFSMAYETLLTIKAEAMGGVSPIARSFGDILGVSPAIGRFYSQ
jgi:hypothetical protein